MQSNIINFEPIGAQFEVWNAMTESDKNLCLVLHIGSGKSYMSEIALPLAATTPSMHKGRDILYVAPTYPMLERIIWQGLKKRCIEHWGLQDERDINNSKKIITFSNGIRIHCVSAETGLKGINAGLIIADEAAEYSEDALQELSNRIRPNPSKVNSEGRMILISTPEGKNPFYNMYQNAVAHPDRWIAMRKNYLQMRVQSKKWIEEQRYLLSPLKFNKDLMCDWGSVEDQFFYTWRREYAVAETFDRGGDLFTFHDFNKKCMTAIVAQVVGKPFTRTGKIEVLKSYAIESCGTEEFAKAVRADWPQRTLHCIMDRSGAQENRDTTSPFGVTDQTILESYGFRIISNAKTNPFIADTDNSANSFIGQGRLTVPLHDEKLIDAIETYHFEDGFRKKLVKYKEQKYMHIDGLGDCLRYGIHYLFPMRHGEDVSQARAMTDDESYYETPGHKYLTQPEAKTINGMPTIKSLLNKNSEEEDELWY